MNTNNGLNTATVVLSKSATIAGGRHVFDHTYPEHKVTDGAFIANCPPQGGKINEGDLGEFDYQTNTVTRMRAFVLKTIATSAATELVFVAGDGYDVPAVNDVIMLAPADYTTGTGKSKKITDVVVDEVAGTATVTVSTFGVAFAVGDVFVDAVSVSDTASVSVKPNVVFPQDIYIYEIPATTYNAATGAKYYTSLFDSCALLGKKLPYVVPAGLRAILRSGYSDIRIVE